MNLNRGDKCYIFRVNKSDVKETTVIAKGPKYLTVELEDGDGHLRFDVKTGKFVSNYSSRYRLYERLEDYRNEVDRNDLVNRFQIAIRDADVKSLPDYILEEIIELLYANNENVSKYAKLKEYLRGKEDAEVVLSFDEIESIIGSKLPPSAHNHNAWWSNATSSHSYNRAWVDAGYRTKNVLRTQIMKKIVFVKE